VVSAGGGVSAAGEYLDTVASHSVSTLPPSVLMREDAELRRLLRAVLEVVADFEATQLDHDVTQVTMYGALLVGVADVATVMGALADAADCGEQHEPVSTSLARAAACRQLAARISGAR
jgi:hypothetical protein